MMTQPTAVDSVVHDRRSATSQRVVVVNGSAEVLGALESALQAGHYDVVFVESAEHAYSQIKRVQPNLVVLCVDIERPADFQVLSMLNLDEDTRAIPIITYTTEHDDAEAEGTTTTTRRTRRCSRRRPPFG